MIVGYVLWCLLATFCDGLRRLLMNVFYIVGGIIVCALGFGEVVYMVEQWF